MRLYTIYIFFFLSLLSWEERLFPLVGAVGAPQWGVRAARELLRALRETDFQSSLLTFSR